MRYGRPGWMLFGVLGTAFACTPTETVNPYLGYTETYGVAGAQQAATTSGGGSGVGTTEGFRQNLTITFRNNHPTAELNTTVVAWVNLGSIRSAQQQDALLASGYVQLPQAVTLGSAFTLPVGTFVYGGSGTAGATSVFLGPAVAASGQSTTASPTTMAITLSTPDAILVFSQPPVSCDSTAFFYSRNGQPLTAVPVDGSTGPYGGATTTGAFKTLAQVDAYECSPFEPGLFFSQTGSGRKPNQYLEGQDVTFDFNENPDTAGNFGKVTIGTTQTTTQASP